MVACGIIMGKYVEGGAVMAEKEKIKIDFLGFNEDNTISDIREFFNDEKNSDCIMSFYETYYNNNVVDKKYHIKTDIMCFLYAFTRVLFDMNDNAYKQLISFCSGIAKSNNVDWKDERIEDIIEERSKKIIKGEEQQFLLSDVDLREKNYTLRECLNMIQKYSYVIKIEHSFYGNRFKSIDSIIELSEGIYHIKGLALKDMQGEAYKKVFTRNVIKEDQRIMEENNNISGTSTVKKKLAKLLAANNKQIVLTGAPGTGKTYGVREYIKGQLGEGYENSDRFKFVQFHSSFDYTDFVEGLKPIEDENGNTEFRRVDGVFKAFCRKAEKAIRDKIIDEKPPKDDPDKEQAKRNVAATATGYYYFVIDEINRADLSRVFGEIMFCLEESYRGPKNKINTQYQSLKTYDADGKLMDNDVFADGFYIPENVIIIGTMNDIDRSVETFDFALRRRFKWEEVDAMESMADLGLDEGDELYKQLYKRIYALNIAIEKNLGKDFQLGMAYFRKAKEQVEQGDNFDPETYYNEELKFILNEYVRGMNDKDDKLKDFKKEFTNAKANGQQ